jgi:hypothetical protein
VTLSIDGVDFRWQTLKRGASEVANAWNNWRYGISMLGSYPEFVIENVGIDQVVNCGKCRSPITIESDDLKIQEKRCGACYSLITWKH